MSEKEIKFTVCILNKKGKKDLKTFLDSLREEFEGFYRWGKTSSQVYKSLMKQKHITFILGRSEREIVSMTYLLEEKETFRFCIVIRKEWQRKGIGIKQTSFTLKYAERKGIDEVRLSCNLSLMNWYTSLGFHIIQAFNDREAPRVEMSILLKKRGS
jgi:GNAT superfamily N-acetyltransferase